jgi:hypothetical protein
MSKSKSYNEELYRLFWQLVSNIKIRNKKPRCWEYKPETQKTYIPIKVYNSKYFKSNSTFLHRYMYAVYHRQSLTPDDVIMHTCDNRICINPKHLKKGTIQTNNLDRDTKRTKRTK